MGERPVGESRAILVDKPAGPTSHDVVRDVRRALGRPKAGHTGTLDPFATGLLVVLTGRATRLAPYLTGLDKSYRAMVKLGERSASGDPEGPITPGGPPPHEDSVRAALAGLTGTINQTVPALSAVKVDGQRLYARTRRGEQVELPVREVVVHRADLVSYDQMTGLADIDIRCGSGTYVRQIATDLGNALGCGGYCAALRRTEVGNLRVDDALQLEQIAPGCGLRPLDALGHMPVVPLDAAGAADVQHGRAVTATNVPEGTVALAREGDLLAIALAEADGVIRPKVVLAG
jgi:tRNA pseudouridine55 synthase